MQPKISVVMSVYNGTPYLRESIESILNQTCKDFEFIIIDDGSSDNTWKILTEYANQNQQIRLFKNEENIA
jgi:glycosyltransferase involved in cell wall biosynthesis